MRLFFMIFAAMAGCYAGFAVLGAQFGAGVSGPFAVATGAVFLIWFVTVFVSAIRANKREREAGLEIETSAVETQRGAWMLTVAKIVGMVLSLGVGGNMAEYFLGREGVTVFSTLFSGAGVMAFALFMARHGKALSSEERAYATDRVEAYDDTPVGNPHYRYSGYEWSNPHSG